MRRRLLLIGILQAGLALWAASALHAQSAGDAEAMAASNELYDSGRFVEAARVYQQLVDQGHRNGALYYNLGNAYYKQGDVGRAILNYRRAKREAPRDADVRANLELARGETIDLIDRDERTALPRFLVAIQSRLTLNELATASLVLWALVVSLLLAALYAGPGVLRRVALYSTVIAGVLLVMGAGSLAGRAYEDSSRRYVVVVAEEVNVISGPGPQYVTEFTLHSGAEGQLIERRGSWARVALPGGDLQGWVVESAVEEL